MPVPTEEIASPADNSNSSDGRAELHAGTTATFWLTLDTPKPVAAGDYTGQILVGARGALTTLKLHAHLYATPLDEADVPIGPWGCNIPVPWYGEDMGDYNEQMLRKCLTQMRADGLTSFSGLPHVRLTGWKGKAPIIDFREADRQMALCRELGFKDTISNYGVGLEGFDNYWIDDGARQRSGLPDYTSFLKAVLGAIDEHARAANWLPVAWNLCDEPLDDAAKRSTLNAPRHRDS
jgi:hypothetical protein